MPSYNKLILVGHVTRDPELRYTPNNIPVCKFGLAVNRKWGDKEEVMFIDVTIFGKRGEAFGAHNKKGAAVLLDGRLTQESWEKDGQKRSKHAMIADEWQFMGGKPEASAPSREDKAGTALDYGSADTEPF